MPMIAITTSSSTSVKPQRFAWRQVDGMKHPDAQDPADTPSVDQFANRKVRAGIAQVMIGAHYDAGLAARLDHGAGAGN